MNVGVFPGSPVWVTGPEKTAFAAGSIDISQDRAKISCLPAPL
jgi:hypothetical protein